MASPRQRCRRGAIPNDAGPLAERPDLGAPARSALIDQRHSREANSRPSDFREPADQSALAGGGDQRLEEGARIEGVFFHFWRKQRYFSVSLNSL
jgi:hypothetical protein